MKTYFLAMAMFVFVLSACGAPATLTRDQTISPTAVIMSTNTPFPVIPTETSTPQVLESTPVPTSVKDTAQWFSSDQLGLCFSYPEGYTQLPYEDTVEIIGPELPTPDLRGLFWLEKSDAYDRTAEVIADQDMTAAGLASVGRSFVTLDGEEAVVLDGMPGQDFQRRVYVVHDQTLYVLAFMPTRSENQAASDQLETLYAAVMNSWAWSPCMVYYTFVDIANDVPPEGSVVIMPDAYILAPTRSNLIPGPDTAANLRAALTAVLKDDQNGWISSELEIVELTVDHGHANVVLQGEYFGVGDVTLMAASMQILMTVFANASVQSATITLNGDTIGNLGVSNSMNAKPADYVFQRSEIETYINEHAYGSP